MCDQLSEFEELRAVDEIYKHDDEIREINAQEEQRQKQMRIEKQRQERFLGTIFN